MRPLLRSAFVLFAAIAIAAPLSCSEESTSRDLGPGREGGAGSFEPGEQSSDARASEPMSTMRIAHLAPDTGAVDFCYRPASSAAFVGPVLGGTAPPPGADAGDAGDEDDMADAALPSENVDASIETDAGLTPDGGEATRGAASFRTVSKYLNLLASGPIRLAIVSAGATSCANALATADVTLDPGKLSTVILFGRRGDGGTTLEVASFTDDRSTEPDKLRVRVIHAALGSSAVNGAGPLAVRAVGATTTVLADRVDPRRASTPSQAVAVDNLGYVTAPPMAPPLSIAVGPAATGGGPDAGFDPWQSQRRDLELHGGSLHTGFILSGASESTFEVLWCADATTSGDRTRCDLVE